MAAKKPKEQEQIEAFLRAKRGYEKRLGDIDWKHEEFLPTLEKFAQGKLKFKGGEVFELGSGDAE